MIPRSSKQSRSSRINGQSKYTQKKIQREESEPAILKHVYTQSKPALQKRFENTVPLDERLFEDLEEPKAEPVEQPKVEVKVEPEVKIEPEIEVKPAVIIAKPKKEGLISKLKNKLFRKNIDPLDVISMDMDDDIPVLEQPFERREDIKAQIKNQTEPAQHFRPKVERPPQQPQQQKSKPKQRPLYKQPFANQDYDYQPGQYKGGGGKVQQDTDWSVDQYHHNDQLEAPVSISEDEREFMGGKKLYDRNLMQQPMYDEPSMQILNDIASDESFPILVQYITQLSHLGRQAQARLIARASAFQSKNQVFSNIQNLNDYMMAQDDFTYAQILSKADYSSYDMNADYFTAEAIMEAQFNIRLRRSRGALNLLQINTQRQESIMGGSQQAQQEQSSLRSKIPFLGSLQG